MRVFIGRVVTRSVSICLASIAAATLLTAGPAHGLTRPAPLTTGIAGVPCCCATQATPGDVCVRQVGAKAATGRHVVVVHGSNRTNTRTLSPAGGIGTVDRRIDNRIVVNRNIVNRNIADRDINDRFSVVPDLNGRRFFVVRDVDGRRFVVRNLDGRRFFVVRDVDGRRFVVRDLDGRSFFVVRDVDGRRVIVIRRNRM